MNITQNFAQKPNRTRRGSAFITATVVSAILSLIVAGYLSMLSFEYLLNFRSHNWSQALLLAETAIEVGLKEINYDYLQAKSGFQVSNGWTTTFTRLSGAPPVSAAPVGYSKTVNRFVNGRGEVVGDFTIQVYNVGSATASEINPILVAMATIQGPSGPPIRRQLRAVAASVAEAPTAVLSKGPINFAGSNAYLDSYNSLENLANYGTVAYVPAGRKANAIVATNSTAADAIALDSGRIYGRAMVGRASGGVTIKSGGYLGPTYCTTCTGIAPGAVTNGFYRDIPSKLLSQTDPLFGSNGTIVVSGTNTISGGSTLSPPTDFRISSISGAFTISGHVRLFVTDDISLSSSNDKLRIMEGSKVEIYAGGNISITGRGELLNHTGDPYALFIYGLPTCDEIKFTGGGMIVAAIYAPDADARLGGSSGLDSGSFVVKTLNLAGNAAFHYNEALKQLSPISTFGIISWYEVAPYLFSFFRREKNIATTIAYPRCAPSTALGISAWEHDLL